MKDSPSVDLAKEFLAQPLAPARQRWLDVHADDGEALLWSLKALSAQHYHSDPQRALEIADAAREAAQRLKSPALIGLSHWITANALVFLERHAEAVTHFERAQRLLEAHGSPEEVGQMLVGYVFALTYLNRYQEALALAEQARSLLSQAGDRHRLGLLAMNVGVVHDLRENHGAALTVYEEAADHFQTLHDSFNLARVRVNMGVAYKNMDRYAAAEQAYRQAEALFALENARLEQGRVALDLGILFVRQGRYGESLTVFQTARRHFEALNVPLQSAEVDLHESQTLVALNLFPEAETLSGHALAVLAAQEQRREAALAAYVHARALMEQGAYEQAATSFSHALARFERLGLTRQADRVRLAMAESAYRQEDAQGAYAAAQAVSAEAADADDRSLQGRALLLAGQALLAEQEHERAKSYFTGALAIASELHLPNLAIHAHDGLAQIAIAGKVWPTARDHQQQALDLILEMRRLIPGPARRAAFLSDKMPLLRRAVHTALELGDVDGALAIMAQLQAGALAESLLTPPLDPDLLGQWQRLRTRLQELKRAWHWRMGDDLDQPLDPDEDAARGQASTLDVRILEQRIDRAWRALQGLHSAAEEATSPAVDWPQGLPENARALLYFPAEEMVWGMVASPDGEVIPRRLGTVKTLRRLLQRWQGHLYQIQSLPPDYLHQHRTFLLQAARRILAELFDFLIAPFSHRLRGGDHLWIAPHDMFYAAPFAALYDGQRYLVERWRIEFAWTPGVPDALSFASGEPEMALVGAYSSGGALPNAAYEATVVHGLTPRSVLLLEKEMTLDALQSLLGRAGLVHLATHAGFRADNPLFSYLQLADGRLTAHDLVNIRLRAQLVVLSACETGRAGALGGDMVGLTQAFLGAGARALLVSQWRLHDPMAAAFMERFYQTPGAISEPGPALARTMRHFLVIDPELHPYFWAPFVLVRG